MDGDFRQEQEYLPKQSRTVNGKEQKISLASVQRVPCLKPLVISVNPEGCSQEEVDRVAGRTRGRTLSL